MDKNDLTQGSVLQKLLLFVLPIFGANLLQGILSTFLVRIPVSFFMSKVPGVSLFQVGLATPSATVFAIVITVVYLIRYEKKSRTQKHENG